MKKIIKKLKNNRGFSLMEMLACIVVMLLVTGIISLTIQMGVKYFTKSVRDSESQVLCGALTTAVKEELEYATNVQATASGYTYYSRARAHGSGCTIEPNADGQLSVKKGSVYYPLVGSESYSYNMTATGIINWDSVNRVFSVTLNILDGDGNDLTNETFSVYPLNEGN